MCVSRQFSPYFVSSHKVSKGFTNPFGAPRNRLLWIGKSTTTFDFIGLYFVSFHKVQDNFRLIIIPLYNSYVNVAHYLFFALLDEKVIQEMYGKVKLTRCNAVFRPACANGRKFCESVIFRLSKQTYC